MADRLRRMVDLCRALAAPRAWRRVSGSLLVQLHGRLGRTAHLARGHSGVIGAIGLVLLLSACGSEDVDLPEPESAEDEDPAGYVTYLEGAVRDTLQGAASFGTVMDSRTGRERFVIEFAIGDEPTAGVYLSRGDTTVPEAGEYELAPGADTSSSGQRFVLEYQHGLIRDLTSESGTLTLETVSDTLIIGTFDARLVGRVVNVQRRPGELPNEGESTVHAQGSFRAQSGEVGFIVDL